MPKIDDRWIEDYFGEFYLDLYSSGLLPADLTEQELGLVERFVRPERGPLLDLACGFGRHALPLARAGYDVVGLDTSAVFLAQAERGARGLKRPPRFVRGDFRALPFAGGSFGAVLLLFNSFGYLGAREAWNEARAGRRLAPAPPRRDPNLGILMEVCRTLRPGGLALLDIAHREPLLRLIRESPHIGQSTAHFDVSEVFEYLPAAGVLRNETYWRLGTREKQTGYFLRLYSPSELRRLAAKAGLQVLSLLGDYDGGILGRSSDRMIALLGRPSAAEEGRQG